MQAMEKRKQSGGGKRVGEGKGRYLFWKMVSLPGSGNSMCKDSEERLRTEGLGTKKRTVRWELREREGGGEGVRPAPIASLWMGSSGLYPEGEGQGWVEIWVSKTFLWLRRGRQIREGHGWK